MATANLLKAITEATPLDLQNRYETLSQKLHEETITPTEHKELLEIIETQKVEQLRRLIELSQLRNVSLDSLMNKLNLHYKD